MAAAAIALPIAATAFQVAGSVMGGYAKANGLEQQSAAMQRSAEYGKLRATQTDVAMRGDLATSLANISAVRATTNTASNSPTGMAILANVEERGDASRSQKVSNINAQVAEDEAAAAFYKSSAENAILGGYMSGASQLMTAATGMMKGS